MAIAVPPIDPNHKPKVSIVKLPATAPIQDILHAIDRDGGIILTDLVTPSELASIDSELEPYHSTTKSTEDSALNQIPKETLAIPGLVGKSPTCAAICENPVIESLRHNILREEYNIIREDAEETHVIDPLLSISITLHIGYGAPRQKLHRDDNTHGTRHGPDFVLSKANQFAVLIAGSKTTRENGATMFIPGSHRWDDVRKPRTDEVCFAEMESGSALIFLAGCFHGGGHNAVPGEMRKLHGLFFIRGNMRTEENQFLAIPRSKVPGMSPKMLSLLGYKKPTSALGIVDNDDPCNNLDAVLQAACA